MTVDINQCFTMDVFDTKKHFDPNHFDNNQGTILKTYRDLLAETPNDYDGGELDEPAILWLKRMMNVQYALVKFEKVHYGSLEDTPDDKVNFAFLTAPQAVGLANVFATHEDDSHQEGLLK